MSPTTNKGRAAAKRKAKLRKRVNNSFCPTGPGGGVDPSCSPSGGTVQVLEMRVTYGTKEQRETGKVEVHKNVTREDLTKIMKKLDLDNISLKGMVDSDGNSYVWEIPRGSEGADHERMASKLDIYVPHRQRFYIQDFDKDGVPKVLTKMGTQSSPDVVAWSSKHGMTANSARASAKRKAVKRAGGGNGSAGLKTTRLDPTRTVMMRKALTAELRRRFARLKALVVKLVVDEDAFGADARRDPKYDTLNVTTNAGRWRFESDREKVRLFAEWLKRQMGAIVAGKTARDILKRYALEGMKKGAGRAFDDVRKSERTLSADDKEKLDFYNGSRDQFLRESFRQPVSVQRVEALAGRSYDDLENITTDMSARMGRTLLDGLVQGKGAEDLATDLADQVDIGRTRAEVIARTEIIRAHAEGQLQAMEEMGVEEVGVAVEWVTAQDDKVCPKCESLEGVVLKISEARGMLPRHPNAVFEGSTFVSYGECKELVRAKYRGPAIKLLAACGQYRTTIGPNHPMVTQRGLVRASELKIGDKVLYDLRHDGLSFDVLQVNYEKVPTCEDVFETYLSVSENTLITSSSSDLHGDREFCQGEVEAIRPTRSLLVEWQVNTLQEFSELLLMGSNPYTETMPGLAPRFLRSNGIYLPASCGMSGADARVSADNSFVWLDVHSVTLVEFEGYAFDYTTSSSLYCNNGFVVKNCRCAWLPAGLGEDTADQIDTKRGITAVLREAGEDDDWGPDVAISRDRPEGIFNELTLAAFCPTGEGGGVDPTCSPGSSGGSARESVVTGKLKEVVDNPPPLRVNKRALKELEDAGDDVQKLLESRDISESDIFTNYDKVREKITNMVIRRSDKDGMIGDEHAEDYAERLLAEMYPIKDVLSRYTRNELTLGELLGNMEENE